MGLGKGAFSKQFHRILNVKKGTKSNFYWTAGPNLTSLVLVWASTTVIATLENIRPGHKEFRTSWVMKFNEIWSNCGFDETVLENR